MQIKARQLQNSIKITYIESPINLISQDFIAEKLQTKSTIPPAPQSQSDKFKQISKRLEANLKKIQHIESKYDNKQGANFKMLKNNLVGTGEKGQGQLKQTGINQPQMYVNSSTTQRQQLNHYAQHAISCRRQLNFETGSKRAGGSLSGNKTLEGCLKEIQQLKSTVKALKEGCKRGRHLNQNIRADGATFMNHTSAYQSTKKYKPSSASKYSYTNYRDLSQRKGNLSEERFLYSDKKFNWMKNPKVQEFVIEADYQIVE